MSLMQSKRYPSKEVYEMLGISRSALEYRCDKLKIPIRINYKTAFNRCRYFYEDEVERIRNYNEVELPKIIYVHTIWEIRESKMNFI